MAVTEKKKVGRPKGTNKKVETKKKVEKLFEGLPIGTKTTKEVTEKPKPIDHDSGWLEEQLGASEIRIKELEDQVIHYKTSYEKLASQGGTGDGNAIASEVQKFFNDLVARDQSRAAHGGAVVKLNYTGQGAMGLLQEFLKRFPFIKG